VCECTSIKAVGPTICDSYPKTVQRIPSEVCALPDQLTSSSGLETCACHVNLLRPTGAGKLHTVNLEDFEVRKNHSDKRVAYFRVWDLWKGPGFEAPKMIGEWLQK